MIWGGDGPDLTLVLERDTYVPLGWDQVGQGCWLSSLFVDCTWEDTGQEAWQPQPPPIEKEASKEERKVASGMVLVLMTEP
jgi:hypothetical protein